VKIAKLGDVIPFRTKVEEKPEKEGFSRYLQDRQQQQKDRDQETEQQEHSREELEEAVAKFSQDGDSLRHGMQADLIGQGPGLKVVLKDGTGVVIRQFTGEEFIKLREAVGQGASRGKILDQKL
jgi:uncharacterized FlaG/YvyC family protein